MIPEIFIRIADEKRRYTINRFASSIPSSPAFRVVRPSIFRLCWRLCSAIAEASGLNRPVLFSSQKR